MKPRPALLAMLVALIGVLAVAVLHPQPMLAPGPVRPAHAAIAGDCFACHTPWQGAAPQRCMACHVPARIGLFTTAGRRLAGAGPAFHQQLANPDCMACHSDHAGPALVGRQPARFDHALLQPAVRGACAGCHVPPATLLHRQMGQANCSSCHATSGWRPARFDHDRRFRLDGVHAVACASCHRGGNLAQYSCYGCHAHQPADMLSMHRREGVPGRIDDCARCHRSAEDGESDD